MMPWVGSVVCDSGISWSNSLTFYTCFFKTVFFQRTVLPKLTWKLDYVSDIIFVVYGQFKVP